MNDSQDPDDLDHALAVEHQRNLDQTFAALVHGGASTVVGCWVTGDDAPPRPAAVVMINRDLAGTDLVAAAPHVVEMLRACADDLDTSTSPPDHVPPEWIEGEQR